VRVVRSQSINTVAAVLTGLTVVAGTAAAQDAPAAGADQVVVQDGHARFEVLTPTLIRLEYAGDDHFQDQTTFTAVDRSFPAPGYTTTVSGGYREIRTANLTLRYRQNSGPFTRDNTSVQLTTTNVTATPLFPSYCAELRLSGHGSSIGSSAPLSLPQLGVGNGGPGSPTRPPLK
jgi:hypothetical protein